jgi:hypothetical protein
MTPVIFYSLVYAITLRIKVPHHEADGDSRATGEV